MNIPTAKRSALFSMSRGRRRALVMVMQLGMVAYAVAFAFAGADLWWVLALAILLQVLYGVIFSRVLRPIMAEIMRKDPELDERELSVRNRAHYSAYRVFVSVVLTITASPMIAFVYFGLDVPLHITPWHILAVYFLFMNLSISLPSSVVAWTEPDPEPEDL